MSLLLPYCIVIVSVNESLAISRRVERRAHRRENFSILRSMGPTGGNAIHMNYLRLNVGSFEQARSYLN